MAKKAKKLIKLTFPQELIKKPVIFNMAMKYNVAPNIRRARVTEEAGEMVLELVGDEKALDQGIKYLSKTGVVVEPVVGNIIE
ncbi:NIL domain-containing protein [Candidatus Saganbacteria bacterium]|uniref:NIL domain-containing protein n=1 Tax=Candidatus Saganbacteria bacterium TaxID=2575572 RepID=A0A9D6YSZ4_UNCSA|nr:NIL domain-containing protein [Candidatus Saganbacteria bacterium]